MRKIAVIFFSVFFSFSFSYEGYLQKYGKKINKVLEKAFNAENLSLAEIKIPEETNFGSNNTLFMIRNKEKLLGYAYINRVNTCREGGCDKLTAFPINEYDHFYYLAVYDKSLNLLKIKILDYKSEHGYEICSKGWLKQFYGSNENILQYNKNIDAISGATVSVHALIDEINFLNRQLMFLHD